MKLLFDLNVTQPNRSGASHGGGKYAIAVFYELLSRGELFDCVYDSRLPLREDLETLAEENGLGMHDLSKFTLEEIAQKSKIDAYYSANSNSKLIRGKRNILTVHGLRGYEMPRDLWMLKYRSTPYLELRTFTEILFNKWWKKRMLNSLRRNLLRDDLEFIVVSEHTKYSCLCCMPELKEKDIKVFYSPSTSFFASEGKAYDNGAPYVLLVSGNRNEKNALRAIVALDEIFSERMEFGYYNVLVTGARGGEFRHKIKNKNNFKFLGYVSEEELDSLYRGAYAFVYPSLNEGFGYPPIEAMRYGVPVLSSPVSSISEVCGDAALYFNPFDYREIKGRLLRLFSDEGCREEYSRKGRKRYEEISARQREDLVNLVDYILGGK